MRAMSPLHAVWSTESQVRIWSPQLSLDLGFHVVRFGFLGDQGPCPQPEWCGGDRGRRLAPAGHVYLGAEKALACRKGLYTILYFKINWLTQPGQSNHRELKLHASGQAEPLQRWKGLSGPKHPGVGESDLSAHSSAPSSAGTGVLGGSWDSGLRCKSTFIFKDLCVVVKSFVCLQI